MINDLKKDIQSETNKWYISNNNKNKQLQYSYYDMMPENN